MLVFFIFILYLYSETESDMLTGQLVNKKTQIGEQKNEATFLFNTDGSIGLPKLT